MPVNELACSAGEDVLTHPVLAAQLYTVRSSTQTAADLAATLEKIRAIGYTAVQLSALGPIPPSEVAAMLRDADLVACNTHVPYDRLQNDLDAVIAEHQLWDCRHVAVGSLPAAYRSQGEQGYRQFAREATGIGHKLYEAGLTFSYHNHAFEFQRFGDRTALEMLYAETDANHVQAEIDTYWVQFGGGDPAAWIRRMQGRMPVVHLKDMTIQENTQQMAEVGEGNLNWPAILDACREAGVEWYAVEQDICQTDPFDCLATSYKNLTAMGIV
jgi:sugar phosphate isomerase/epimerase